MTNHKYFNTKANKEIEELKHWINVLYGIKAMTECSLDKKNYIDTDTINN